MVKKKLTIQKVFYYLYLDHRSETMKITQFNVEEVFGDFVSKDSNSPEQTNKLKNVFVQKNVNFKFCRKIKLFKPREKYIYIYIYIYIEPSAPP